LEQEALAWLRHPAHSLPLRQLLDKDTAADYRRALALNAALPWLAFHHSLWYNRGNPNLGGAK